MSFRVTQEDILSIPADAAAIGLEMTMRIAAGPSCQRIADAGGEALRAAVRRVRFIPLGSAAEAEVSALPFRHLLLTGEPRWLNGKCNELLVLRHCYESVFSLAESLGCRSLVMPFLSALYFHFPKEDAVHIALTQAEEAGLDVTFVADTPELLALSGRPYRRPEIVSYVGYYGDHALFELDNGLFARVDLRPELTEVSVIPYFEACYRTGNNPLQPLLPDAEVARLRRIYEESD